MIKLNLLTTRASRKNPYLFHHIALSPLLARAEGNKASNRGPEQQTFDEKAFQIFVQQQGLAPMWDEMLRQSNTPFTFSNDFSKALHQARLQSAGLYLAQKEALNSTNEILGTKNIVHVVYKGAHHREQYYTEPSLRPALDIDILIDEKDKFSAIKAFRREGFDLVARAKDISHEVGLKKGAIAIDLHWDILRPGRTKIPITRELLKTRKNYDNYWGMNDESSLFVMLVHPVFAKYGTAPQARLMRLIDLTLLLEQRNIQWQEVLQLLAITGLKTAAWLTLKWLEKLTGIKPAANITEALKPGVFRQQYFNYWLDKNLATSLLKHPKLIQLGFTLPAHDRLSGAVQAVRRARKLKRSQQSELTNLLAETQI
ncbi:MAG: nucleotidyltransferase family protein [Porticoccaceae bacterium]|nr:nucleotidyltransferase family protein [Porticoccaceae bacterium]